jgi:hypothetical protein
MISHEALNLELNYPCFNDVLSGYSFMGFYYVIWIAKSADLTDTKDLTFSWIHVDLHSNELLSN